MSRRSEILLYLLRYLHLYSIFLIVCTTSETLLMSYVRYCFTYATYTVIKSNCLNQTAWLPLVPYELLWRMGKNGIWSKIPCQGKYLLLWAKYLVPRQKSVNETVN